MKYSRLVIAILSLISGVHVHADDVFHAQGEFAGEPTATSVLLQSRLTAIPGPKLDPSGDVPGANGVAFFEWSDSRNFKKTNRTDWLKATPDDDYIVRAELTDLDPGTRYFYRLHFGSDKSNTKSGPIREFKTLPAETSDQKASFIMGSCQNYAFFMYGKNSKSKLASEKDRKLGYPAYSAMLKLRPDFFIGTGDIVYYDHPAKTAAKTRPELREKWHEQFRLPRLVEFYGQTAAYWLKDDHDYRFNDSDLKSDRKPSPDTGIAMFREQMPILPAGDLASPTYRTHRVHKHLQLWFLEGRDYRSPNRMEDGPQKSLWGPVQKQWLQTTLKKSDATWKVLISPTPMVGPDSKNKKDNHANLGGFRHEADAFFRWLQDNELENVMVFCGDRHWQYHSIHPLGIEEFSCGALNDENAIIGSYPGAKNSTDPEGKVRQPFHYAKPSGGFLFVTVDSMPNLTIDFRNDEGTSLYKVSKSADVEN
ncbi:alkaline phosphatase D family protein [Thalassoroseus pseudoceratinae]|uniref:alkaline phosphatase D family protein n=1 Tax=Thalassoroseus pseudoceratinae TaxID=2713176 RepID=UPI0014231B89|nr:alkaline phosphatase D family protein [Thalassoroseus pseudoceratinae]